MRKRDIQRDASGPSIFLSTIALILSGLAVVAYFILKPDADPQQIGRVSATDDACQNTDADPEAVFERLSVHKEQSGNEWSAFCQEQLDSSLYETAIIKATEGRFSTAFDRLCQIPEGTESEYFEEAQFLFGIWEKNRNTSGEPQEIRPLLQSFFEDYDNPNENCPAARETLEELS
ncbi:MAG: hypothetical protein ACFB14_23080 [Leptolyngbyaceae cyanobacterium]